MNAGVSEDKTTLDFRAAIMVAFRAIFVPSKRNIASCPFVLHYVNVM
jgi:hypothetical protein